VLITSHQTNKVREKDKKIVDGMLANLIDGMQNAAPR
jgi:hypothetical protein